MRDIFVVCRSLPEFNFFLSQCYQQWQFEVEHNMVHYVHNVEELKGLRGCRVVLYGQYFKRKDWPLIDAAIKLGMHRRLLIR